MEAEDPIVVKAPVCLSVGISLAVLRPRQVAEAAGPSD